MHALIRLAGAAGLVALLAGCYGAPTVDQPISSIPPGQAQPVAAGSQCYAGFYTCVLPAPGAIGSGCSCPGLGGPSYGTVR